MPWFRDIQMFSLPFPHSSFFTLLFFATRIAAFVSGFHHRQRHPQWLALPGVLLSPIQNPCSSWSNNVSHLGLMVRSQCFLHIHGRTWKQHKCCSIQYPGPGMGLTTPKQSPDVSKLLSDPSQFADPSFPGSALEGNWGQLEQGCIAYATDPRLWCLEVKPVVLNGWTGWWECGSIREASGVIRILYGDTIVTSTALDKLQLWMRPYSVLSLLLTIWAREMSLLRPLHCSLLSFSQREGRQPRIGPLRWARLELGAPQRAEVFGCRSFIQSAAKTEPVRKSGFQQGSKIPK